jgi:hypothetical protein
MEINFKHSNNKKTSAALRNIDFNAYRAFKLINSEKNQKSPMEILKVDYNLMKVPFGLTERRFRWQTEKLFESMELKGNFKKKSQNSLNNSVFLKSTSMRRLDDK